MKTKFLNLKWYAVVLFMLLTIGSTNVWGASVTLSLSDFGWTNTSYSSKSITKTVGFTCNNGAKNGTSNMAFKKSASLWNTSAFSQNITSVVVNVVGFSSASSAGFYIYGGTSAGATTTTIVDNSGATGEITADFSAYSYKYFTITVKGSRAMYVSSIVINYGGSTKTFTLMLPKGDGTYDNTTTTTNANDLGDADIPFSKKNCGGETLNGTFTYMWTNSAIARASASTSNLSDISPKYDKNNPPSSSATLYPLFYDGVTGLLHTAPVCVEACANSVTIQPANGTGTNCTFTVSPNGAQESCDGVSTTVSITPTPGYGKNPSVTQSGASAAPTISGSGNSWTVTYAANTTGTSTINVSCSANNYTITLDKDLTPTTAGTASITATYNANTNLTSAITKPTKTGWTFGGYFTAKNGGGTQIIDASGNVIASVSGYTDASRNWKHAGNITLYAKWTCTVTWSVNGLTNVYSTQTVTYNSSSSKVASVPTPDPASYCGDIFAGWSAKNAGSESKTTSYYDDLFKTVGDSPDIKNIGDITFYAVFADED